MLFVYGIFLLLIAAIVIFSGKAGRRQLVLALACGGAVTLLLPFLYGAGSREIFVIQLLYFPVLVCLTWLAMFAISRFRNRQ